MTVRVKQLAGWPADWPNEADIPRPGNPTFDYELTQMLRQEDLKPSSPQALVAPRVHRHSPLSPLGYHSRGLGSTMRYSIQWRFHTPPGHHQNCLHFSSTDVVKDHRLCQRGLPLPSELYHTIRSDTSTLQACRFSETESQNIPLFDNSLELSHLIPSHPKPVLYCTVLYLSLPLMGYQQQNSVSYFLSLEILLTVTLQNDDVLS